MTHSRAILITKCSQEKQDYQIKLPLHPVMMLYYINMLKTKSNNIIDYHQYLWYSEKSGKDGRKVSDTYVANGDGKGRLESKSQTKHGLSPSLFLYIIQTNFQNNQTQKWVIKITRQQIQFLTSSFLPECTQHGSPRESLHRLCDLPSDAIVESTHYF